MTTRKWIAACAFGAALLLIASLIIGALTLQDAPVAPGAAADAVRKYYAAHAGAAEWGALLDVLWTLSLAAFVWPTWQLLHAYQEGKFHKWARESIIAAAVFVVLAISSDIPGILLAQGRVFDDAAVKFLNELVWVLDVAQYFPLAMLIIVISNDLRRASITRDWIGRWGLISGAFLLIGELWIFATVPAVVALIESFTLSGTFGIVVWLAAIGTTMLTPPKARA